MQQCDALPLAESTAWNNNSRVAVSASRSSAHAMTSTTNLGCKMAAVNGWVVVHKALLAAKWPVELEQHYRSCIRHFGCVGSTVEAARRPPADLSSSVALRASGVVLRTLVDECSQ